MYAFRASYSIHSPLLIGAKKKMDQLPETASDREKKEAKILLELSQDQHRSDSILIISDKDDGLDIQDILLREVLKLDPESPEFKYTGFKIDSISFSQKVHLKKGITQN